MSEETEETETDADLHVSPQDLIQEIMDAAITQHALKESFLENFNFDGASLAEWTRRLHIEIPDRPDGDDIRNLWIALARKIQIVAHYHSIATSISTGLSGGGNLKKADIIAAIVASYQKRKAKRPAGTIIEKLAESYMSDTMSTRSAATVVKTFWRQRLDALVEMRKCLEQLSINLNVERKWSNE